MSTFIETADKQWAVEIEAGVDLAIDYDEQCTCHAKGGVADRYGDGHQGHALAGPWLRTLSNGHAEGRGGIHGAAAPRSSS